MNTPTKLTRSNKEISLIVTGTSGVNRSNIRKKTRVSMTLIIAELKEIFIKGRPYFCRALSCRV